MAKEKGTRILLLIGAAWLMVGCERQHQPVAEKTPAQEWAQQAIQTQRWQLRSVVPVEKGEANCDRLRRLLTTAPLL